MRLKNNLLFLMATILMTSCSNAEQADTKGTENTTSEVESSKAKISKPVTVDAAVERALEKMTPAQKQALNMTPLTAGRYPSPPEPNFGPETGSILFNDTDAGPTIGGILTMKPAIDQNGNRVDEAANGITSYTIHWGLEVGAPGLDDDTGNGDLGGNCMNFRDPSYIVKTPASAAADLLRWEIPAGTVVPEGAVYFVGQAQYGTLYNLKKCTQIPIENFIEK